MLFRSGHILQLYHRFFNFKNEYNNMNFRTATPDDLTAINEIEQLTKSKKQLGRVVSICSEGTE